MVAVTGPAQVVHSPEYVGRALAGLMTAPDLMALSGGSVTVGELACRYGFTDIDGRQPPFFQLEGRSVLAARMARLNQVAVAKQRVGQPTGTTT